MSILPPESPPPIFRQNATAAVGAVPRADAVGHAGEAHPRRHAPRHGPRRTAAGDQRGGGGGGGGDKAAEKQEASACDR